MSLTMEDFKILLADVLIRQREVEILAAQLAEEIDRLKKPKEPTDERN